MEFRVARVSTEDKSIPLFSHEDGNSIHVVLCGRVILPDLHCQFACIIEIVRVTEVTVLVPTKSVSYHCNHLKRSVTATLCFGSDIAVNEDVLPSEEIRTKSYSNRYFPTSSYNGWVGE